MKDDQQVNSLSMGKREFAKSTVEGATGSLYDKQIIKFGNYVDPWFPEWPMTLDSEWGDRIKTNFDNGVVGRVAVPASHTDDPEKNRGELLAVENDGEGLNGTLDIRDPETVAAIENGLIWDDSISFTNNYIDETGTGWGPVLFHVALVNNPYITGMKGFQALSKAASHIRTAFSQKHSGSAIVLSKQIKELSSMKPIKNEKEFEVKVNYQDAEGVDQEVTLAPGQEIEVPEATVEGVKQQIDAATAPEVEETADEKKAREDQEALDAKAVEDANVAKGLNPDGTTKVANEDAATNDGAPTEGAALSKAEREELETLRSGKAEAMFSKLVEEGKVLPAQKEAIMALAKSAGPEAVAAQFAKASKVIDFSENGSQTSHKDNNTSEAELSKANVKQWSDLSASEQETNTLLGITEESFNATALANPKHYQKEA